MKLDHVELGTSSGVAQRLLYACLNALDFSHNVCYTRADAWPGYFFAVFDSGLGFHLAQARSCDRLHLDQTKLNF